MKLSVLLLSVTLISLPKTGLDVDFQLNREKEILISSCLENLASNGFTISDTRGRRYLDCTIYIVENELVSSEINPSIFGESVCILEKSLLFQLGIETFLEVKKLKIYPDSAEVDIFISPYDDLKLKLSKRESHWLVH